MQVIEKKNGTTLTIYAEGRIDALTAVDFGYQVHDALDDGDFVELVLDFVDINYISSVGLRVILELQKRMKEQGSMSLINVKPAVLEVFAMTGFTKILTIV